MITAFIVASSMLRLGEPSSAAVNTSYVAAPITLRINAKPGEVLMGTRSFRVVVDTDEVVNQVEFYVNGQLRTTDESSPYDFELDSLKEQDGPVKIRFVAYTALSHKAEKELSLSINNQVALGPDAHVKKAKDYLTDGKFDEAVTEGRIALKARPGYVPARLVLARAFAGKGILDEALNNAQEAVGAEPNNPEALDLQAYVELRQAFNTYNTGGERKDTLAAIKQALIAAVTARRKVLDAQVDAVTLDPNNPVPYANAAIKAGRYSAAISALSPVFEKDNRKVDVGNRLAYAQLRSSRITAARSTMQLLMKYAQPDAYSYALSGILAFEAGDMAASDEAMKQALLNDISNVGVRTAQAYIALRRNRSQTLAPLAQDLAKEEGQRSEVSYYLSALYNKIGDYTSSRRYFERALLAEPTNADAYIEQGNKAIDIAMNGKLGSPDSKSASADPKEMQAQLDQAHSYFEVALQASPSSAQALTGLTIVSMLQGNSADAAKYGEAAIAAGPEYTAALYSYAGALQKQIQAYQAAATRNRQQADTAGGDAGRKLRADAATMERSASDMIKTSQNLLIKAAKLDPTDLGGREAPDAGSAYRYYARHGQVPVISAP